ncbi:type IV pilus biogenesis/stability protein PilW [Variovorax ureilyticus]|uniref:type IV pilus biogenesis/stability protein PilW n=1 Tax=Variovorax ureilyticus TaxID=1836198 RepID=UPI003D665423
MTESDETNARKRAKLRVELAIGYFQQGQTTVALDEIKQALAADPTFPDAYILRGVVYMRLDDPAGAEDSFRRALALNPREPNALHNYGWLLCQQNRFADAQQQFNAALSVPSYPDRAKTLMTQGICQLKAGQRAEAERSLTQAYEIDAGNPVIGYNLASMLAQREEWSRAQFYIRRINNSPSASAETLWLGIKIERQLNNREAVSQLGAQLQRRFPSRGRRWLSSAETSMIERASEFGASAAVPLVGGDSTNMTAGGMLREAREAHGLHLDVVAAALKVSPQKLAALEADDIASLPDPVFARALAASVCRALRIDPAPVLAKLPGAQRPGLAEADRTISKSLRSASPRSGGAGALPSRPLVIVVVLLLIGAAVLFWLPQSLFDRVSDSVSRLMQRSASSEQASASSKPEGSAPGAVTEAASPAPLAEPAPPPPAEAPPSSRRRQLPLQRRPAAT